MNEGQERAYRKLEENYNILKGKCKAQEEQIYEMQLLLDKANEKLKGNFSEVVSGWVSVEDRLPEIKTREESESVLVFIVHKGWKSREIIKYNHKQGFWNTKSDGEKVTHWMPLPEKPNV